MKWRIFYLNNRDRNILKTGFGEVVLKVESRQLLLCQLMITSHSHTFLVLYIINPGFTSLSFGFSVSVSGELVDISYTHVYSNMYVLIHHHQNEGSWRHTTQCFITTWDVDRVVRYLIGFTCVLCPKCRLIGLTCADMYGTLNPGKYCWVFGKYCFKSLGSIFLGHGKYCKYIMNFSRVNSTQ